MHSCGFAETRFSNFFMALRFAVILESHVNLPKNNVLQANRGHATCKKAAAFRSDDLLIKLMLNKTIKCCKSSDFKHFVVLFNKYLISKLSAVMLKELNSPSICETALQDWFKMGCHLSPSLIQLG